jgi:AraC-like DNA-binding protein
VGNPQRATLQSISVSSGVVNDTFGTWTYFHCRPEHLAGLIEHIWLFDGSMTCRRERTFPDGLVEVIVHLGERYRIIEDRGVWLCPAICVGGQHVRHLVVEAPAERTTVLGIRLTPAGAYALFARPMHELAGLTVDLGDVAGSAAAELAHECDAAPSGERCIRAAVEWIDARLARGATLDPAVGWILGQIRRHGGVVSIGRLREHTGWSKTRLASTFQEQVGVTPKQYARVMRFSRVMKLIHAETASFADIANQAGYYDQPHMNAEFKEISGLTPTEFQNAHRYAGSVSVAET